MATDLLDVALGAFSFKKLVGGSLKKVLKFVGDAGLAQQVGDKAVVTTTTGTAGIDALAPATQLIESAKAGNETAKAQVATLAAKAEAGDSQAQQTMGVLDIAAAGLRASEQKSPEVAVGKKKKKATKAQLAKMKADAAKRKADAAKRQQQGQRPGQPGNQLVNRQQIAQSMQGMTPQQQQVFQQNLLAQQQQNLQSGMLQGYDQYGNPLPGYGTQQGYPQQTSYPGGYAVPMQQGFPGGYVQQEQFADTPPDDLSPDSGGDQPGDVELADEPDAD